MSRGTVRLLFFSAAIFAAGCGYVGDPLPPLANVPGHITDLAAVERGGRIFIHFSPPTQTTEGMAIKTPLKLELRIGTAEGTFHADTWAQSARPVADGTVEGGLAQYEVPASEWTGKEITIGARAIGSNGKAGPWSNFANLMVVPPPAVPADVTAAPVPEGVRLTWQGGAGEYRVFRRAGDEKAFAPAATVSQPEWVDTQTEYGKTYTYEVQRLERAGAAMAESELSAPASITPKDVFPPAAPRGLRAIAGLQTVELTWERNTEADLAGYRLYRATGDGPFERIEDLAPLPAYSDHKVEAGKAYRYEVSAVDQAGNESGRSAAVAVAMQ